VKVAAVTSGREGKKNEQIHSSSNFGRILTIPIVRNIPRGCGARVMRSGIFSLEYTKEEL
jgi:hypothetical protein